MFAHPWTGRPYDGQKILKRFKQALSTAGLRDGRFHDLRRLNNDLEHFVGKEEEPARQRLERRRAELKLRELLARRDFAFCLFQAFPSLLQRVADTVLARHVEESEKNFCFRNSYKLVTW